MFNTHKICDVLLESLLHDDKLAYKKDGYGGKLVWHWPIYRFFKLYYIGEKTKAEESFVNWYLNRYQSYGKISNSKGGMKNGSLDRLYRELGNDKNSEKTFRQAVQMRVNLRFQLFEDIITSGYIPNHKDPVRVITKNRKYNTVISGHHRIAIMAVLNIDIIPDVYVFKNNSAFLIHRCQQKFGKYIVRNN